MFEWKVLNSRIKLLLLQLRKHTRGTHSQATASLLIKILPEQQSKSSSNPNQASNLSLATGASSSSSSLLSDIQQHAHKTPVWIKFSKSAIKSDFEMYEGRAINHWACRGFGPTKYFKRISRLQILNVTDHLLLAFNHRRRCPLFSNIELIKLNLWDEDVGGWLWVIRAKGCVSCVRLVWKSGSESTHILSKSAHILS